MSQGPATPPSSSRPPSGQGPLAHAPFLHAPEASRNIFLTTFAAACLPLGAGVFFFGWRALVVAGLSIGGCVAVESAYYRLTRTPALMGRTHAALTGLLLALTLPAFVPLYVPLVGAVFAILVGKALFGGVGHFLWQPALVGRLAVTVIFPTAVAASSWPVLTPSYPIYGDVTDSVPVEQHRRWVDWRTDEASALRQPRPSDLLRQLTLPQAGQNAAIAPSQVTDVDAAPPPEEASRPGPIASTLALLPPAQDILMGAHGGGIGETCTLGILVVGLYLVYRNYVHGVLPGLMILSAAVVAAVGPVRTEAGGWQWLPIVAEDVDVGFAYVSMQLAAGELMLAAWFLATEMTSRPVTPPGQAIFGLLCGALAMGLQSYTDLPIPAYTAVLACNTLTPLLDGIRPRVFGRRRWWRRG